MTRVDVTLAIVAIVVYGCSLAMDEVVHLGERGTDERVDSMASNENCEDAAIFDCYENDVWCFSSDQNPIGIAQDCEARGCEGGTCLCENGWSGDHCDEVTSCLGVADFTFCNLDTTDAPNGDSTYDVCIGNTCVSPGRCDTTACNASGMYFPIAVAGESHFVEVEGIGDPNDDAEKAVLDEATGLTWMKCPLGQRGINCDEVGTISGFSWTEAMQHCNQLTYAGYDDWYLPSDFELLTLIDFSKTTSPLLDDVAFPSTPPADFWTSSVYAADQSYIKRVFFDSGILRGDHPSTSDGNIGLRSEAHPVRCVRRDAISPLGLQVVRSSGEEPVVTDFLAKISWVGCVSGRSGNDCVTGAISSLSLTNAVSFCDTLSYGGQNDWRLPTPLELFTLYGKETVFPNLSGLDVWSTPMAVNSEVGYYVNTIYWVIGARPSSSTHPVLCVRTGVSEQ